MQKQVEEEKEARLQKEIMEKRMADEMRRSAMETMSRKLVLYTQL